MTDFVGGLFPVTDSNGRLLFALNARDNGFSLSVTPDAAVRMFRELTWMAPGMLDEPLGLYNHVKVGSDRKAKFMGLRGPKHNLRKRTNGCVWSPTPGGNNKLFEIPTHALQVQNEICPDITWDTCLESLIGPGVDIYNLLATPQGAALVRQIVDMIYSSMSNSTSELLHFSNHPLINTINTNGTAPDPTSWLQYYEQQMDTELQGFVTQLDQFASEGFDGHTVTIPSGDINANNEYIGDIQGLLEKLRNSVKFFEFRQMILNGSATTSGAFQPIIKLSDPLWTAWENWLIENYNGVPYGYQFMSKGMDNEGMQTINVARYKGMPVVPWKEVSAFDAEAGTVSFRASIFAPGVLGIASDVDTIPGPRGQAGQYGLVVSQDMMPPAMGKIYAFGALRLGALIRDDQYCASTVPVVRTLTGSTLATN